MQFFGLVNASAGFYSTSLFDSSGNVLDMQNLTASSSFLTTATLFYASGLNDSESYKLVLTNLQDTTLSVESVTVTYASKGSP